MIRRRRPLSHEEMHKRLQEVQTELESYLEPIPSNLDDGIVLLGTLTATDLYERLDAPQGWSLRGFCDLVGGFALGDERASSSLTFRRTLSLCDIGTVYARFITAHNRPVNLESENDRSLLFQILESPAFGLSYPLVEHMGQNLATRVATAHTRSEIPEHLELDALKTAVQKLNEQFHVVGYDHLWNEAFSSLR